MSEKYRYLKKNTILFAISSFGTKFLSFFLVPLYTNVLSTAEYGTVDLITTTATLLIFILTINIAEAVLRFSIEEKKDCSMILSYGIRVLIYGSFFCSIGLIITYLLQVIDWPLHYYIFILLYFVMTALYQILTSYLRGIDKVKQVAIAGIITSIVIILSNIFFLLVIRIGIIGYLVSLILGPTVANIFCLIIIHEPISVLLSNTYDRKISSSMRAYCIPLIFNNIALWINAFLDRYFVTGYCGISENGIYSVASKIPTILATCYTVFSQAWNLSAIKEYDPKDQDGFFSNTYSVYNALIVTVCSVLILINVPLSHFLYAKEFFLAWQYSSVLLISVMFNSLTIIIGSIFSAAKKTKAIATTTVLSAIVNTVFNIVLIPLIGALGAAIATAAAYFVMWIARLVISRRYLDFKVDLIRDCTAYIILSVQVIFEHITGHAYLGQVICFLTIQMIYHKQMILIIKKALGGFKR